MTGAALAALLLAGCGLPSAFEREPQTTDLVVSAQTIPEVARVSVPMPLPAVQAAPVRAEGASLWRRERKALFDDTRAARVGDIVTVTIDIDDEAQLRTASERQRQGQGTLAQPSFFGYGAKIAEILPGIDDADLPDGELVDISSAARAGGSGSIRRGETISLKIAALVLQELPNGAFVVAGRQEVKVNNELRELRIAGIVRPQDILTDNTIPYERIAEARIAYGGKGALSRTQKRSYGEDALDIILPY